MAPSVVLFVRLCSGAKIRLIPAFLEPVLLVLFSLRKQATFRDATDWFPRQMTSEKRAQKFRTDEASLPRSG